MDTQTRLYVGAALAQLRLLLRPLVPVAENPYELFMLLSRLGWKLDGLLEAEPATLRAALDAVRAALLRAAGAGSHDTPEQVSAIVSAELRVARARMNDFGEALLATTLHAPDERLARALALDLTDYLCTEYLRREWPTVFSAACLMRLITRETVEPLLISAGSEQVQVRFPVVRWKTRAGDLVSLAADPLARLWGGRETSGADLLEQLLGSLSDELEIVEMMRDGCGLEGMSATLGPTGLTLRGEALPVLPVGAPPLTLVLPVPTTPVLRIDQESLSIVWATASGIVAPEGGLALFDAGGFKVLSVGGGASVTLEESGSRLQCRVSGGVEVRLPPDVLRVNNGARAAARAQASLLFKVGERPRLTFETLRATVNDLTLAGCIRVEQASVELRGLTFPLLENQLPYTLVVEGQLALPASDTEVEVRAALMASGFELTSEGQAHLGDGIRLRPVVDSQGQTLPVLRASVAFGQTAGVEFEVRGRLDVPTEGGEPLCVEIGGRMRLALAGDEVSIESFDAAGELQTDWRLPGGATLGAASLSIKYNGAAHRFQMTLGGELSLARGVLVQGTSGGGRMEATLLFNTSDPLDVHLDGTIRDVRLELPEGACVFGGQLGLPCAQGRRRARRR